MGSIVYSFISHPTKQDGLLQNSSYSLDAFDEHLVQAIRAERRRSRYSCYRSLGPYRHYIFTHTRRLRTDAFCILIGWSTCVRRAHFVGIIGGNLVIPSRVLWYLLAVIGTDSATAAAFRLCGAMIPVRRRLCYCLPAPS